MMTVENCPTVVHLYDFPASSDPFVPRLRCVFQHSKPVLHAQWNPVRKGSLALCTGSGSIYTWSDEWIGENGVEEDMAECIGVPANSRLPHYFFAFRLLMASQLNLKQEVLNGLLTGKGWCC